MIIRKSLTHLPFCLFLVLAAGCASTPTTTKYQLTSNPEGAEIYRGTTPDNMTFYATTPFHRNSTVSLNWSYKYFQARKEGFKDSEIHHQPMFRLGTPTTIHFELESLGGEAELAPYRTQNTLAGYREFLTLYPGTALRKQVFEHMVALIEVREDRHDQYEELLTTYPGAIDSLPAERQLTYLGPAGLRVHDIVRLSEEGIGTPILERKILTSGGSYRDFGMDEIKRLQDMGLDDVLIAAMMEATTKNAGAAAARQAPPAAQAPRQQAVTPSLVIPNNSGRYMSPYTSDGVVAEWVDKAINAEMGSAAGSAVGAAAGAYAANKALENVPFGGMLGGILGSKAGKAAGREAAIEASGGMDYIRNTSDQSFNSLNDMARYLVETHSTASTFAEVVKATNQIYPGLADAVARTR